MCLVEAAAGQAIEHVGQQGAFFQGRVGVARVFALGGVRIEGLGAKANRLLVQAQGQPVGAQLLGGVVVQQLVSRGRLHRSRGRSLALAKQHMVVSNEASLANGLVRAVKIAGTQGLEHGRLSHAVKVQVVLANELIHLSVLGAPEIAPAILRQAQFIVAGLGEANGRPQTLGPALHGKSLNVFQHGGFHAPLYVAGDAEGHQGLAGAEANAGSSQNAAGLVAIVHGVEP